MSSGMNSPTLKDILISSRQESLRMQHYYEGVEHLFIALLQLPDSVLSSLLMAEGYTPEYVIDAVRQKAGKGTPERLWAGMRHSPRYDVVMGIANDFALDEGRSEPTERDLINAIFEEGDNLPLRVLRALRINTDALAVHARMFEATASTRAIPTVQVEYAPAYDGDPLTDAQLRVLRRVFAQYDHARVERQLRGEYTNAVVYVVTPFQADDASDSPVIVKIDDIASILDEATRYETLVKNSLPPLTARLEERPTTLDVGDLGGLKYTFVTNDEGNAYDLRVAARDLGGDGLSSWLREELYASFGKAWWGQRRPYRFTVWAEYDWLLPPLLRLDAAPADAGIPKLVIKNPVRRHKIQTLDYGDRIAVDGFTVHRLSREKKTMQMILGNGAEVSQRACKIDVRDLDFAKDAHYRGEVVERVYGNVYQTRDDLLQQVLRELEPPLDAAETTFTLEGKTFPNPVVAYEKLLDVQVSGTISTIHGDLHLGNILVGVNDSAFLIDFADTRTGHTLFDWACLEVSLINELVDPALGQEWGAAVSTAGLIYRAMRYSPATAPRELIEPLAAIATVRSIAGELLATPGKWTEYDIALAFCALRGMTWTERSISARRILFMLSAYAMRSLLGRPSVTSTPETRYDATEAE